MKPSLPMLLSLNAGYVDAAGFLALHGLLAAHITGNLVTFGAAVVLGTSGAVGKLLALPAFCITVALVRLVSHWLTDRNYPVLKTMLCLQFLALGAAAFFVILGGPFANGNSWGAIFTGMSLTAAMAIQNAAHRIHVKKSPPTTVMTGNVTEAIVDMIDTFKDSDPETRKATKQRMFELLVSIAAFATGCILASAAFRWIGVSCLAVPPAFSALAFFVLSEQRQDDTCRVEPHPPISPTRY